MTNNSQKGRGYVHVTSFCLRNCGLIKKFRHDMLLAEFNNAVDDELSPSTVDASAAIH